MPGKETTTRSPSAPSAPSCCRSPCWTRTLPACLEEARKRLAQGVKVFRLFPDRHGYPIDFAPAAELLEELAGQVVIVATAKMGAPTALARLVDTGCRTVLELEFPTCSARHWRPSGAAPAWS